MAGKNITIAGAIFNAVPSIDVPISGGGTASYVEISDTTAAAADVASGKFFYDASGVKTEGTASGGVDVEALSVTANGTYTAPTGKAYSPVTVNVSGGGGGSSYTLLHSEDIQVSTTSTSGTQIKAIACGSQAWTKDKIVYVRVRDKAGKRAGYFYGTDTWFVNISAATGGTGGIAPFGFIYRYTSSSTWQRGTTTSSSNAAGVYAQGLQDGGTVLIYRKYHSTNSLTIDGTFAVEIYLLDWPGSVGPFP